jgi:hypothetical protein
MKRDEDLARQLLLDIENRGADCSVGVLRTGPNHDAEDRVRYHLRLLIDAGWLKELDRTGGGVPCVRLTHAGHEMIELARSEARWREAKWICQDRTGGLSLAVIRSILLRWSVEPRRARSRRYELAPAGVFDGRYRGRRRTYRFEPIVETALDAAAETDGNVRYVRVRPTYRDGWCYDAVEAVDAGGESASREELDAVLPEFLV